MYTELENKKIYNGYMYMFLALLAVFVMVSLEVLFPNPRVTSLFRHRTSFSLSPLH